MRDSDLQAEVASGEATNSLHCCGLSTRVTPAALAAFLAAPGKNAVALRWQPTFGATSYTVKCATNNGAS
ncbi:MAG: hypothetical protein ABI600_07495 [Luteolibacter sp.]